MNTYSEKAPNLKSQKGQIMANYITNDIGERVVAVGQDGSVARMRVKYPGLITKLDIAYHAGITRRDAEGMIIDACAGTFEVMAILNASSYIHILKTQN